MRESLSKIQDQSAQLLAVDPHEVWAAMYLLKETALSTDDLRFPLLLDPALTVSATYGVAGQMRIHTEWSNRPATFVIDREGIIRFAHKGTSFNDRPSAETVVAELENLSAQ